MAFRNGINIQMFSSKTLCSTLLAQVIFKVNLRFNLVSTIIAGLVYRVNFLWKFPSQNVLPFPM